MIQALLVDLDDTLLENDLGRFIPAYFDLLAADLAPFGSKDGILAAILAGTKAMLGNRDPERTLAEVFFESFEHSTGAPPAEVSRALAHFYGQVYPQLRHLTRPKPGALAFLQAARRRGLAVAVATNPLMIDVAIEHRLAWAGAPPSAVDYALISDVEGFHFAKPQLAYFAEVLGHLGRLPTEAVMVGNDPTEDLDPAAALGLPVFHLSPAPAEGRPGGDYHEALRWLEAIGGEEPQPANRPEALVARFEGQLAAMLSKLRRIGDEGLRRPAGEGGLAPLQIVCHLRDVDREVNLPRLQIILERDNPFLSSVNTDDWIEQRGYIDEDPQAAVRGFIATRKTVTAALSALTPDQWQRPARHSLLGPTTLVDWIAVLAEHDLRHLADVVAPRKITQRSA